MFSGCSSFTWACHQAEQLLSSQHEMSSDFFKHYFLKCIWVGREKKRLNYLISSCCSIFPSISNTTHKKFLSMYTPYYHKGALLPQFPTTTVYNTCHCILQCTCHICIFDIHTSATILNSHYSSTHSCEKTPEECGEGTDCHLTTEISQSNS